MRVPGLRACHFAQISGACDCPRPSLVWKFRHRPGKIPSGGRRISGGPSIATHGCRLKKPRCPEYETCIRSSGGGAGDGMSAAIQEDVMPDYGRRIVIDLAFDRALGAIIHAVRDEGLE